MKLTHLRTNHITQPLGLFIRRPVFSWVAEDTTDKRQACAQIVVEAGGEIVYDSGRREDVSSLGFEAPVELKPRTRYQWTVTVWGDGGDTATASSWFETAKQEEPWAAQWIAADFADKETQPLLAKSFTLPGEVESARAYACGVGIYELEVNGQKAGDEYLLPGYHCYDFHLEYQTFDITGLLRAGENTVGLALAPGWYKGDIIFDRYHNLYGDTMQAICEIRVKLKDGAEVTVPTDLRWKSYPSPVTFSNIYDGEHYDARREVPGWSQNGCQAQASGVIPGTEKVEKLIARLGPKIVKKASFTPTVLHTKRGETVLDFGQNMTGWVEFDVSEPAGTEVVLTYGEVLQDGCFYRDNLRSAKAEYRYISKGEKAHVRPHGTFYGFRYVKVEGVSQVRPEDFAGVHIRSDIDPTGSIETADSRVNQLFHNAMWGQFDNFLDIPTDCPQRDERLGWTGDAAIISATACKNLYMPAFFHHFLHNVGEEQRYYKGAVPFFVPAPKAPDEAGAFWLSGNPDGCAIWSDVATMMPWAVYENYGDLSLLREEYPVMKAWVERIRQDDQAAGPPAGRLAGLGPGGRRHPEPLWRNQPALHRHGVLLLLRQPDSQGRQGPGLWGGSAGVPGAVRNNQGRFPGGVLPGRRHVENPRHPDGLRAVPVLRAVPRWQTGRGAGGFEGAHPGPGQPPGHRLLRHALPVPGPIGQRRQRRGLHPVL